MSAGAGGPSSSGLQAHPAPMTIAIVIVIVAALAFALGPRVAVDTTVTFNASRIGADPDAYLASSEAAFGNIRPGLQKEVAWADPATKAETSVALVYVHGFSASKGEVRPLPDKVAQAFGANLFYTRLTGHGQDGAAMATASVNAWVNDFAEAIAIGRTIGERVVVMCTSTGGALATWAATQPKLAEGISAIVALSPNYGVRSAGSSLLPPLGQAARTAADRRGAQFQADQRTQRAILDDALSKPGAAADGRHH